MNTIYIIFIAVVSISFILGLFVTFFKAHYKMKLHKYNNSALQKDNYEYAKDYIYDTNMYKFHEEHEFLDEPNNNINNIETNIHENTIVIPIINEDNTEKIVRPRIYSIMDDDVI